MKNITALAPLIALSALIPSAAQGQYIPFYSDPFSSINTTYWQANGSVTAGNSGLTGSGSVIYTPATPAPSNFYEIKTTLTLNLNSLGTC